MSTIETIRGRATRVDQFDGDASAILDRAEALESLIGIERPYATVAAMKADADLLEGNKARTLGYYTAYDGGGAEYTIETLVTHGATPDGYGDHSLDNGLVARVRHPRSIVVAEKFGVISGSECSARFQEAFYSACDLAGTTNLIERVLLTCAANFLIKNRIYLADRGNTTVDGVDWEITGSITVTTGGNLAASTYANPVFAITIRTAQCEGRFGLVDCNRICAGIVLLGAVACVWRKLQLARFHRCGVLVPDGPIGGGDGRNGNTCMVDAVIKQWLQGDTEFDDDAEFTADCVVVGHKDWQCLGGQIGWSRAAVVLLDHTPDDVNDHVEGRNVYAGYKSQGAGDFFWLKPHLMQGRPGDGGPPRMDNVAIGGPILIEAWSNTNKWYFVQSDLDSGTLQLYAPRGVIDVASFVAGGANRFDDRVVVIDPVLRLYANGNANPAGFEMAQNNNLTVGLFPFESFIWTGDYSGFNYTGRQKSPGYEGAVAYQGIWDAATAGAFPSGASAGHFWLVRATPVTGSTFAGHLFMDGDLLFALVNAPSTSIYAANWYGSANNQVDQNLRGTQVRVNAGEQYLQATSADIPLRTFWSGGEAILTEYRAGSALASTSWDGTTWQHNAAAGSIALKNWKAEAGGNWSPVNNGTQDIGDSTHRVNAIYAQRFYPSVGIAFWSSGNGTPEGAVTAPPGSIYSRLNGGAGTSFYVKESGTGDTGWVGK